ncbi:hypothetical protein GGX14DRAFT_595103 [Mycena pura]|uniref:Transmembrane protein n=1 Tax=Mycena pura TaxID=153505 RepID=A0AAD6VSC6_9AGAR|nr:hypothetical protein GGX14DRAFT_595103 [Mycena pura]
MTDKGHLRRGNLGASICSNTSSSCVDCAPDRSASIVFTGPPITPKSSAFGSASAPTSKAASVRRGPIVGGVVGGLLVLGTVIALCVVYRRRQRRLLNIEDGITPRAFTNGVSAPGPDDASKSTQNQGVDTRENPAPQPLSAVPLRGKGTLPMHANVPSSAATHRPRLRHELISALAAGENRPAEGISGLAIPELARMLYERVRGHNDQVHESPPPSYLSAIG